MRADRPSAAERRSVVALAAALLIGLLLAACSGDNGAAPTTSYPGSGPSQELTREQVVAMMPTRRELHLPLWGVMSPAEQVGGPMDNRRAARETGLWSIGRESLDAAGRLGGYVRYYWDGSCGGSCLDRPLLTLRTEAHIFRNTAAASRFLRASAAGYLASNAEPGRACTRVSVQKFEPVAIGDEVIGLRTEVANCEGFTGYTWRDTVYLFRVDRVVCLAKATSLNDSRPAARALGAARVLERRVDAVLSAA